MPFLLYLRKSGKTESKKSYVFVEGDLSIIVFVNALEVPVELILADVRFFDAKIVSQENFKFLRFEGGVMILVIGLENRLEPLVDHFFDVESGSLHWIC